MSSLMKAEWYSITKRKMLWFFSLLVLAMSFLMLYLDRRTSGTDTSEWDSFIGIYLGSFQTHLIMTFMYCCIFFGSDMDSGVFKNILSKGETNGSVYIVKLLTSTIYSALSLIVFSLVFYYVGVIFFGAPADSTILSSLLQKTVHFFPFILAANAVAYFFLMIFQPKLAPIWMFLYLTLIPALAGLLLKYLFDGKLLFLDNVFISKFVVKIVQDAPDGWNPTYFGVAAAFYVVAGTAGYFLFRRKEY